MFPSWNNLIPVSGCVGFRNPARKQIFPFLPFASSFPWFLLILSHCHMKPHHTAKLQASHKSSPKKKKFCEK